MAQNILCNNKLNNIKISNINIVRNLVWDKVEQLKITLLLLFIYKTTGCYTYNYQHESSLKQKYDQV